MTALFFDGLRLRRRSRPTNPQLHRTMETDPISPTPFLAGERVALRALRESDADGPYADWLNDAEVCRGNSHHVFPYTRAQALDYIRQVAARRDELVLAVTLRADGRHIGNIALQHIHPVNRSAELSILLGDRAAWGQGCGVEAAELLLAHAFSTLNLERVACGTFGENQAMQKLALRLGMREEGRRRRAVFKDGRYDDVVEYGVLRDEFLERKSANR